MVIRTLMAVMLCFPAAAARPPSRCLGEYRSPDYLVGASPLIVIGTVEKVKELPVKERRGEEGADRPSEATVRISRILKGRFEESRVRVGSGPVESCSPEEVHYTFHVGQKAIFILPTFPAEGKSTLERAGSLLDLDKLPMVEARILRARAYREEYLEGARKESPTAYKAGLALALEMRVASLLWPVKAGEDLRDAIVGRMMKVEIDAIRVALAADWLDEGASPWWRQEVWERAAAEIARNRSGELERAERARVKEVLKSAGVDAERIGRYVEALTRTDLERNLEFPPDAPYAQDLSDRERLTTDFIVGYHSYDRGRMFVTYGMRFDLLAGLDPERVSEILPGLYGSDDDRLRLLAVRAIERIPGKAFVGLILDRLRVEPNAWHALRNQKDPKETDKRLAALVKQAEDSLTTYGIARTWEQLRKGECFEDAVVFGTIRLLESLKEAKPAETVPRVALLRYLSAAMAARKGEGPAELSTAEYRAWFRSHPAPKE